MPKKVHKKYYSNKISYNTSSLQNTKMIKYYFSVFFDKVFFCFLLIISLIIINFMYSNKNLEYKIKSSVLWTFKPVYFIVEVPFNIISSISDNVKNIILTNFINKKLKEENIILKKIYLENIDTINEFNELKKLLNFKDEIDNNFDYLTTKIYSISKTGLNSNFFINVGFNENIKEGSLVFGTKRGVIGRVINIDNNSSNVLLLDDINSRIPARTSKTQERIILVGTNKNYLEISYFNSKNPNIVEGDLVFTSGDSNLIPDGFYIGKVQKKGNKFIVKMEENINNIFNVMILTSKRN